MMATFSSQNNDIRGPTQANGHAVYDIAHHAVTPDAFQSRSRLVQRAAPVARINSSGAVLAGLTPIPRVKQPIRRIRTHLRRAMRLRIASEYGAGHRLCRLEIHRLNDNNPLQRPVRRRVPIE
jgi:hypothetical protein